MPQLPSGLHVAISSEPIKELARRGDFKLKLFFPSVVKKPIDMAPLICIVNYHPGEDGGPGEPYPTNMSLADIDTDKCEWSETDKEAFRLWLARPQTLEYLQQEYDEVKQILEDVEAKLPESLTGVLDPEEVDSLAQVLKHNADDDSEVKPQSKSDIMPGNSNNDSATRVLPFRRNNPESGLKQETRQPIEKYMNIFNLFRKKAKPKTEVLPDTFDTIAVMCKFMAIEQINPEFYKRHYNAIQMSTTFVRLMATNYPPLKKAFQESLAMPVGSDADPIRLAFKTIDFPEEKLQWINKQMTVVLKLLLLVVRDPDLPSYFSGCKWAIEESFYPENQ